MPISWEESTIFPEGSRVENDSIESGSVEGGFLKSVRLNMTIFPTAVVLAKA